MNYTNPIISGCYPDPSICRADDTFYLVTSSFQYFPGVPLFKSKDLITWEQIGHCLTRETQLPLKNVKSSGGIFAPTIRYNNGRFYMITTNTDFGGNFFVYTDDIDGEWSDPIYINHDGIDPSLFFDEDEKVYFTSNGTDINGKPGIFQCELDIKTGGTLTEPICVWHGTGGRYPESPHLYKIGCYYYLVLAEGGTEYGHMETIARSKEPYGPFEACPNNPILTHKNLGGHPIQGVGHGDLFQDEKENWWMVFLGFRTISQWLDYHHLGREVFLAPVTWSEDGWPIVNETGTVELAMEVSEERSLGASTNSTKIREINLLDWNFLRNPYLENYKISNIVSLKGTAVTLNDVDSPSFIGIRQKEFECEFETKLSFEPKHTGEEAGITIYMDEDHHYEIAILREAEVNKVIFRQSIGSLKVIIKEQIYTDKSVILQIKANRLKYIFSFSNEQGETIEIGQGDTRYLSSEVAGGFTGVYFGLYATGNGKNSITNAEFKDIEIKI